MISGNAGYDNFRKLNSSSVRKDTDNVNDKKMTINTTANNATPIKFSITILVSYRGCTWHHTRLNVLPISKN